MKTRSETASGAVAGRSASWLPCWPDWGLAGCGDDSSDAELTIAVENAYLPFNYLDPDTGEPSGWDYEVLDEICERIGCTPVFENFPWEPTIQAVADGQFDMAADGITITEARAEIVDFSNGYINVDQRLMVRKGEDRFVDAASFAAGDFVLGTQIGTTNYDTGVGASRRRPGGALRGVRPSWCNR